MSVDKVTDREARSGRALFLIHGCSQAPLYRRKFLFGLIAGLCVWCTHAVQASTLRLQSDATEAPAGYYQLTWRWPDAPANITYSLIETSSLHAQARQIYHGPDLASVISGKRNGTYRYLVQAISASGKVLARSNPLRVVVSHHSLVRAWVVFGIGALIFLATLIVILRETAKNRE